MKATSSNAVEVDLGLAEALFGQLDRATRRGRGIVRDSYGTGEQAAHDIVRAAAEGIGLEISVDAIGNLTMMLPGKDRRAPRILIGSHLDSVPQGGNFDGAAGVVAGLCALAALRQSGFVPACDIGVMAIRAEESSWFDVSYLGSAGAFGLLDPQCLSVRRSDNGRTLEETLLERGFDPTAIGQRRRLLEPDQIRAYLELHIEQGPRLMAEGIPAAVVTGIRGCKRFRNARCLGQYGHSGAQPRTLRQDAVAATVAFLHHMEGVWLRAEEQGADLLLTTGELYTDSAAHAPSKVAGETRFVLDLRSVSEDVMETVAAEARRAAEQFGTQYRVSFDLGAATDSPPAMMDARLRGCLLGLLNEPLEMPSGAGHDAAVFAELGIPSAMIFVRNDHGSHNPEEAMALEDFGVGTCALIGLLQRFPL
ncbi:MAG: beta-ureidopropionase / N-carbamoyl-L-amino-acid hydrolase [Gammaproteobacteria bacterium]|nr:beta-ureidopropionase / N-carbamoyl-L-amino-acid hydrolase [Gammaproteobacteria bacterium]